MLINQIYYIDQFTTYLCVWSLGTEYGNRYRDGAGQERLDTSTWMLFCMYIYMIVRVNGERYD